MGLEADFVHCKAFLISFSQVLYLSHFSMEGQYLTELQQYHLELFLSFLTVSGCGKKRFFLSVNETFSKHVFLL